jgi:hypothetical protein
MDPAKLAGPRGLGAGLKEPGSPEPLVHAHPGHDIIFVQVIIIRANFQQGLNGLARFLVCVIRSNGPDDAKLFAHEQTETDRARYHLMLMLVDARRPKASCCSGPAFGAGF